MSQACLFCGIEGPGVFSNEHVNPKWLLKHLDLPDEDQLFQAVASTETGELVAPPRIHSTFSFVQGRVCEDCNCGWMSRLEDAAKPLLIPLMDRSRDLKSLSPPEAALVGKWAAKTAYLHTWAGPMKKPVEVGHLRRLHGDAGAAPEGVGVFGMQADFVKPSAYIQTGLWPQLTRSETTEDGRTPDGAYKLGLQFRHLYLLVAFWPNPRSLLTPVRHLHIPLIPEVRGQGPDYVVEVVMEDGPIGRLAPFSNSLGVWHPEPAV